MEKFLAAPLLTVPDWIRATNRAPSRELPEGGSEGAPCPSVHIVGIKWQVDSGFRSDGRSVGRFSLAGVISVPQWRHMRTALGSLQSI